MNFANVLLSYITQVELYPPPEESHARFCPGLTLNKQYIREICKLNHVLLHGMHFIPWIYFTLVIIYYAIPSFLCRISLDYILYYWSLGIY